MQEKKRRRRLLVGLAVFLALTAFLLYFVQQMDPDVFVILSDLPLYALGLLFALGFFYNAMEAAVCHSIFRDRIPHFTMGKALDVTYLGVFGNVTTLAAGSAPMQSFYLYRQGLSIGSGMGLMTLEYVFHKASVLVYTTLLMVVHLGWLGDTLPAITPYLLASYGVCLAIITTLVLLCTWGRVRDLAERLIALLPDKGRLTGWKQAWRTNLEQLYTESQKLLHSRGTVVRILLINWVKLAGLYAIPWVGLQLLGLPTDSFFQVQLLTALMHLISNALPNVAGMGSIEVSFYLIFSGYVGEQTMALLILYRLATYYFPFFLSCFWFAVVQHKLFYKTTPNPQPTHLS